MPGMALMRVFPRLGTRTQIMGVLNVTPDSFSDGGRFVELDAAIQRAETMKRQGADVLDVGGETTRPGSEPVSESVELARVLPVIEALIARGLGPISVDTTKAEVAARAVAAGAQLVNDISAMSFDPRMPSVIADLGVGVVLMHTRARPKTMQTGQWTYEGGVVVAVRDALTEAVTSAARAGIDRENILVDPGIGFGKTLPENLALLDGLERLRAIGCPILVGTSRKSFIGEITGRTVTERTFGTAATVAWAIARGVDVVRVHDVAAMRDVARMCDALRSGHAAEEGLEDRVPAGE